MTDDQQNIINKDKTLQILTEIDGFVLKALTRQGDERWTWNYKFRATPNALKKVCLLALQANVPTRMYLDGDDEVTYCVSVSHYASKTFLAFAKKLKKGGD